MALEWICFNLLLMIGFIYRTSAGSIKRIKIDGNKIALKGGDIQLVCKISQFSNSDTINVYKSDTRLPSSLAGISSLTQCFPLLCLTITIGRYKLSADSSHVFINITDINRSEDQKWWTCAIGNQRKELLLNVITVPTSLQYENPPSESLDLAEKAVQLKCSTGCSYPRPSISWYYSELGNGSLQGWSSSGTDTTTACSDSEKTYFSTLSLPRYTTFLGNLQKTVQFKCSIQSFTGMSQPLYSSYSTAVQFAVKVSSATLKDGANSVSGHLQVVNGVSKTLACDTGVSRPAATIVWYIGTVEMQRSMSNIFTFNPDNSYHSKKVYCKTFNIQPENQAVSSYKSTLQVQVQVSNVTLKDGSKPVFGQLQVVYGVSKTLTCDTDVSRPTATIVWYIGTGEKQRSTSNNFTFTPDKNDHYKKVYCKAFNTQPESQAVASYKSTIYVKGSVERIYVRDNKAGLKESDIQLVCEIPQFSNSDILSTYKSDTLLPSSLSGSTSLTQCIPSLCLTTSVGRYTFSADSSHVFIHISRVNRSEDQKWWTCAIGNQRKNMLLTVITVPISLQYENPPSQDQDLAENAVLLKCTTGCSYPRPTISWYYSEFRYLALHSRMDQIQSLDNCKLYVVQIIHLRVIPTLADQQLQ